MLLSTKLKTQTILDQLTKLLASSVNGVQNQHPFLEFLRIAGDLQDPWIAKPVLPRWLLEVLQQIGVVEEARFDHEAPPVGPHPDADRNVALLGPAPVPATASSCIANVADTSAWLASF